MKLLLLVTILFLATQAFATDNPTANGYFPRRSMSRDIIDREIAALSASSVAARSDINSLGGSGPISPSRIDLSTVTAELLLRPISTGSVVASNISYSTSPAFSTAALMGFTVASGETWSFEFNMLNGCNGTGGMNYAISGPAGTLAAVAHGMAASATARTSSRISAKSTATIAFNAANLATGFTTIRGTFIASGNGTLALLYKPATPGQTATIHAGSYFTARKM